MTSQITQLNGSAALSPRCRLMPLPIAGRFDELLRLLGAADEGSYRACVPLTLWRLRPLAVLQREGASIDTLYVLRSGSLKSLRTLEDGYEQVLSIAQPGDLIGIEALHGGEANATVVALEDCTVFAIPARDLIALQRECASFDAALWRAVSRQLGRAAETAEMMAAVASEVRVARFLLWTSRRMAEMGHSPRRLLLRMGRRDIASLLSVAHETVSRAFTALAETGCIRVNVRDIEILDMPQLQARAKATRGAAASFRSDSRAGNPRRSAIGGHVPALDGTSASWQISRPVESVPA
jgi:CRP/FNR family transcriptional regulator, anaerobic regulatory protein